MPYLAIDIGQLHAAWEAARIAPAQAGDLDPKEQLDFGRRAVAIHVPQSWPHGTYCHNCGHPYPCRIVTWGMRLLQQRDWDLPEVIDLIESVQGGDPL